ncbi:DnaA ATPase domain-containing protein [Gemmatimonas groenlandica]|uniref:Chromosomal replication initiator protein DnaA n=1 Tax=Gemmatimonas groenlandica TaxID=2732249 RepID=A0A6M4IP74_9BACT|nr:DnaA/Hda family protein [Gemmatimonas groenlandica]QJR35317.1 ATP-binding protein [Gemmatimonas groenlandica]
MSGPLDGNYRFDTFVVGSSNRLAVSAARAVAEAPGSTYNPLFVYGGSGLGKTHLVAAIAHQARAGKPDLRVEFTSGEDVAEHLQRVIASGQGQLFIEHYQQVELLILDDVQFLTGQRETQSELLRLFNIMQGSGRQLVLTSDRQPSEIPDVDQRLLSRLIGGLVVDVGAPDYEMRLAILRNVAGTRGVEFADGVLNEVARLAFGNVRELKGALNKLSAFQQLEGTPVAPPDVRAVLGERASMPTPSSHPPRIEAIIPDGTDYEGFLADVLQEVETRVEPWRVALGEAISRWKSHGYSVAVLERAMQLPKAPDVDGLLATFTSAIEHLRNLEAQASSLDPALRGHAAFRDVASIPLAQQLVERAMASTLPLPAPSPVFTRERIDVSSANQLAVKAIDSVIENPGTRYNPLFICGPAGSGKSHLAHALGNAMRPRAAVACLSASAFVDELIAAMQEGGMERWRLRFRAADLFILDDVEVLAGKERTQEELFHLFNHLYERGAQIALTSTYAPRELPELADRLRSRFEGGLVVALQSRERHRVEQLVERAPGELDRFFEDREKTMWNWPDLGGRVIEEYR